MRARDYEEPLITTTRRNIIHTVGKGSSLFHSELAHNIMQQETKEDKKERLLSQRQTIYNLRGREYMILHERKITLMVF